MGWRTGNNRAQGDRIGQKGKGTGMQKGAAWSRPAKGVGLQRRLLGRLRNYTVVSKYPEWHASATDPRKGRIPWNPFFRTERRRVWGRGGTMDTGWHQPLPHQRKTDAFSNTVSSTVCPSRTNTRVFWGSKHHITQQLFYNCPLPLLNRLWISDC